MRKFGFGLRRLPALIRVYNSTHGYGNPASALCAVSTNGMISVSVIEENMNAAYFLHELEQTILPAMHRYPEDESVLLLDNAPTHDHLRIIELCQRVGVICIFLPRYGYDLSPIEPAFYEIKAYIRRVYGLADGVCKPIGRSVLAATSSACSQLLSPSLILQCYLQFGCSCKDICFVSSAF